MLPRYAHIGKSIKIVGGRISVLGSAVFALASFAGIAIVWVLNMETTWFHESHPAWQMTAITLFAFTTKAWIGHWLFKPLPVFRLPTDWQDPVDLGLWQSILARLPFLEWAGFGWTTLWRFKPKEDKGETNASF